MKAMDCADYIIEEALKGKLSITNLQLQKALYVFAAEYIRKTGDYPYGNDCIEAWRYGPVIRTVYIEYKYYGSEPIKSVSLHEEFNMETFKFVPHSYNQNNIDKDYKDIVKSNLKDFLNLDVFDVIDFTHKQMFWKDNKSKFLNGTTVEYPNEDISLGQLTIEEFIQEMRQNGNTTFENLENIISDMNDTEMRMR